MKSLSPMCRILSATAWLVVLAAFATLPSRTAWAADGAVLQSIDVTPLTNERVQLTLHLSGPAPQPLSFTIDNPARIAIDLPNTTLALPSRRIDVQSGGLDSILAAEAKDRSRLVLSLDHLVPYDIQRQGNDIIVTVGSNAAASTEPEAQGAGEAASAAAAPTEAAAGGGYAQPWEIRSIDFRRGADGSGRVIVRLSDPHIPINLQQVGNQIVVDFANATVPTDLVRRYDASDFGTPVTDFDVTNSSHGSRIAIDAGGEYDQLAYQSNDEYVVELQPLKKGEAESLRPKYTGERLTLNFQDISVRAVLQLLMDASGKNIVVSDTVTGNVTLRLQNVPWDQALAIILQTKGLGKVEEGNVILVEPQAELAAREKADLAAQDSVQQLEPLRSEYLQVNYAKAADLAALIKGQSNSLLSKRGNVAVDDRTNTLLLQDTPDNLEQVNRLVARLDVPVRQVEIEARVVLVNDDFNRQLGATLGLTDVQRNGQTGLVTTTGSCRRHGLDRQLRADQRSVQRPALPGLHSDGIERVQPLQRQPARGHTRWLDRRRHSLRLEPGRPRALRRRGRDRGQGHLFAAGDHRQPETGDDHAGRGNPVPAVGLERRHFDLVQERGAAAAGHSADHARQPHHPRPRRSR